MNLDAAALERLRSIRQIIDDVDIRLSASDARFLRDWTVELAGRLIMSTEQRRGEFGFDMINVDAIAIRDTLTGVSSLRLGPRAYTEL